MDTDPNLEHHHELLESSNSALKNGDAEKALELAREAYLAFPNSYPYNYKALSISLKCLGALEISEEAEEVRKTMEKILWEHDTKLHAEGEARAKHPLKKEKGP